MATEALVFGERHYVPDPSFPNDRIKMGKDNVTGRLAVQCTRDGGKTWSTMSIEPSSFAGEGWVPTLSNDKSLRWAPGYISASGAGGSSSSSDMGWTDFMYPGDIVSGVKFGVFRSNDNHFSVVGAQVSYFVAPIDNASYFEIVNSDGNVIGPKMYAVQESKFVEHIFPRDVAIIKGVKYEMRASIPPLGSINAGSFASVRLLIKKI